MRFYLLVGFAFLVIQIIHAQNGIHLEYKMSSMQTKGKSIAKIDILPATGTRSEMEFVMPQLNKAMHMVMIYRKDKPNTSIQVNDQNKTYTEFTRDAQNKQSSMKPTVKVIGKEKIGTYNCIHSQVNMNTTTYELWTTKDIDGYTELLNQSYFDNQGDMKNMFTELKKNNADGFMVKMQSDSKSAMSMELIKVEEKTLDTSLFSPPADYKKLDKGAFTQQQIQDMIKGQ
ncbi:DUF4412 domain-containing protein [Cytophagaceae bacterium YF14B1]|uniref:DUF4412 domain-containing protein n=1 Tax=Xanthocytophaga flava TaxID=3048013 RepID=A0AAE3U4C7_9BACT|nr:DUF4412 domain-containing protein [Xanthocytophaga flavus]MDJ1479101.1 DUF4412 domain-containing protein [Xanthocytophaga flavus]